MVQIQNWQDLNKLLQGEKMFIDDKRTCSFIRMTRVYHEQYDFSLRSLMQKINPN